jgi:hypothetical protein
MKNFDELEQLKSQLEYKASLPDANFELKLKKKLLKQNSKDGLMDKLSNIFNIFNFNYSLALNLFVVVLLIGVGIFIAFNLDPNTTSPQPAQNRAFSKDTAKQEILNNVIKNNPLILIQETTQTVGIEAQSNDTLSQTTTMKSVTDNNLIYRIVMSSEFGPQGSTCLETTKQPKKTDLTNYTSNDSMNFYFKSVSTDNNENVLNYYLSDNSYQIYYTGGLNAIKYTLSDSPESTSADLIKETLIIDAIISIETKTGTDNVQYIQIVQREENKMCSQNDNIGPVISTIQIEPTTFKILSKSYYSGSESIGNLIIRYDFETFTYEPDAQMILDTFKYDLDFPLVEGDLINQ